MTTLAASPSTRLSTFSLPISPISSGSPMPMNGQHVAPLLSNTFSPIGRKMGDSAISEGSLTKDLMSKTIGFGQFGVKGGMTLSPTTREVVPGPRSPPTVSRKLEYSPDLANLPQPHASTSKLASSNGLANGSPLSTSASPNSRPKGNGPLNDLSSRKGKEPAPSSPSRDQKSSQAQASLHQTEISTTWPNEIANRTKPAAGLRNPSMACYANATLQIMMHTPPFVRIAMAHKEDECALAAKNAFCALCVLSGMIQPHWFGRDAFYSPEIHKYLGRIKKGFNRNKQEDTHEFFRFVTDALQSSALAKYPKNLSEKLKHTTWVYKVWGGKVRSRVLCSRCDKPSDTFDDFLDLSLDVNGQGIKSIENMLSGFVKQDKLEGQNKYHCETCKAKTIAMKGMRIAHAPPILTLHLKRFSVNFNTHSGTPRAAKNNSPIEFREELDIAPYMVDPSKPGSKYRLFGVTCHNGSSPTYGHYISYVRSPKNKWFRADDEDMLEVDRSRVLNDRTAYLLSYMRIGDTSSIDDHLSKRVLGPQLPNGHAAETKRKRSPETDAENERQVLPSRTEINPNGIGSLSRSKPSPGMPEITSPKINILQPRAKQSGIATPNIRPAHPPPTPVNGNSMANGSPRSPNKVNGNGFGFGPPPSTADSLFPSGLHALHADDNQDPNSGRATAGDLTPGSLPDNEEDELDQARQPVVHSRQNGHARSPKKRKSNLKHSPISETKFYQKSKPDFGFDKSKLERNKSHGAPMPYRVGRKAGVFNRMQKKNR